MCLLVLELNRSAGSKHVYRARRKSCCLPSYSTSERNLLRHNRARPSLALACEALSLVAVTMGPRLIVAYLVTGSHVSARVRVTCSGPRNNSPAAKCHVTSFLIWLTLLGLGTTSLERWLYSS